MPSSNGTREQAEEEKKEESEEDDGDPDYEDFDVDQGDVEEEAQMDDDALDEHSDHMVLEKLFLRRFRAIPELKHLLKTKTPAATLPFLMASNLTSFLFYSRYYNGNLLDVDPLRITAALTAQLLSKDSQHNVTDEFQSSYFDHLKALVKIGQLSPETISDFQPMVLQDIKVLLHDSSIGK